VKKNLNREKSNRELNPGEMRTKQVIQFGPFRGERTVILSGGKYVGAGRWKVVTDWSNPIEGDFNGPNRMALRKWFKLHIPGTQSYDLSAWFNIYIRRTKGDEDAERDDDAD